MSAKTISPIRRTAIKAGAVTGAMAATSTVATSKAFSNEANPMELLIDHVMFPVYANNAFLDSVESLWAAQKTGKVHQSPQNALFKGLYFGSKSFYVEYLSNTKENPYWSNAVCVVVPKKFWGHYQNPAMKNDFFLTPSFGCGYFLVSPDFPHLHSVVYKDQAYDGFTLLISKALEKELLSIGGQAWRLPASGKLRVHEGLLHAHDMAVINEKSKLVAPLLQTNPLVREFL